jgi:hypothetical protein
MSASARKRHAHLVPPGFAPAWLRRLWGEQRTGAPCACPGCAREGALGVSVHASPQAYRLQCVECAWRSPWFETLADRRLLVVGLDTP